MTKKSQDEKEKNAMSIQNKLVLRRFFEEIFNQGNLAAADEIVSSDYVNHNAAPTETPGREGLKQFVTYARAGFRDLHFIIDDQVAEGDKVVTRWTATGIHQGEFAGIAATGKPVTITAINIHRVADGQIQEGWLIWDALGLLQQLGVQP
jgi:steroid delta-isomerase-like uncharacterized protein